MRNIHRYALLAIVAISAGLMLWAVIAGMRAPESDKIASTMQLIGQYDEDCEPIKDSLNKTLPVKTNADGIEAIKSATIYQMRNAEGLNYIATVQAIQTVDYTDREEAYLADCKRLAELDSLEANDVKTYKKNLKKNNEERKQLASYIAEYEEKVAPLLAEERDWAARLEGVRGSDFEKESDVVLDYMQLQYERFAGKLAGLEATLAENEATYTPAVEAFDAIVKGFGVEYATKRKNNNDELSELMTDYTATITAVEAAIAEKEKAVKGSKKTEVKDDWKDNFEPLKKTLTPELISTIKAYDELITNIETAKIDVNTTEDNVKTLKAAVEAAKEDSESLMALATAISWNIYWLYFLMVFAICFVFAGFVLNFIQDANWVKIGVTTAVVLVVVLIAYLVANGHGWNDGEKLYVLDANGFSTDVVFGLGSVDSPDRYVFTAKDYMLADISIWITYLAFVLGVVAAVASSVRGIFKK